MTRKSGKKAPGKKTKCLKSKKTVAKQRGTQGKRGKHAVSKKKVNTDLGSARSSLKISSNSKVVANTISVLKNPPSLRLPDWNHDTVKPRFGGHVIVSMQVKGGQELEVGDNFLSFLTGHRSHVVRIGIDEIIQGAEVSLKYEDETGRVFQLLSSKECDDNTGGGTLWAPKKKLLELFYVVTSGPDLEPVDPGEYLGRFGNFAKLPARKVASRLELFQSPGRRLNERYVLEYSKDNFVDIEENGHEGCGFIDEEMLYDIIGRKRDGEPTKMAACTLCIQVRVYLPSRGIYKGMLMRKKIGKGPKVQLPSSMKKVEASSNPIDPKKAYLLVNKAGVDPSANNQYLGMLLDPRNKTKVPKDFRIKPMSEMIRRLLYSTGVPEVLLEKYERSVYRDKRKIAHSFVRGVADPTGCIPPNHAFITGLGGIGTEVKKVFITRSPCILASDACVLKVLTSKPKHMRKDDFEWLNSLPFGIIIFAFPKNGMKPLPTMIADGDLDGDRYFLLWENSVLAHVNVKPLSDEPILKSNPSKTPVQKEDPDWFIKAQTFMADPSNVEIRSMMGQLFNASGKAADDDKKRFLLNPNAVALSKAFKQALDNKKHGIKIALPTYLWHTVGKRFHEHLTPSGEDIVFRKEIEGRYYNGRVLEYPIEPNKKGTLAKVMYENGEKGQLCIEDLKNHIKCYRTWVKSQKGGKYEFTCFQESSASLTLETRTHGAYQGKGPKRKSINDYGKVQSNLQSKRKKRSNTEGSLNNDPRTKLFSIGHLFHRHVKTMNYDGDRFKNMYWSYDIAAVADEKAKTYKVRSPDLSVCLMSHEEIEEHTKSYEEFCNMVPGSSYKFPNHIVYYCTNENDTPDSISVEFSKTSGLESCPELASKLCQEILNSDYNMIHFGNLSSKTKFKSGSKVQIDFGVRHKRSVQIKMTRHDMETEWSDFEINSNIESDTRYSVSKSSVKKVGAGKRAPAKSKTIGNKDKFGLYPVGMLFHKHAEIMNYDGDRFKNMYWAYDIIAILDRKTKIYKVRSPDLSVCLMSHDEIDEHTKSYEEFCNMVPGSFYAFTGNLAYYCTNENDTPDSISVERSKISSIECSPKLVLQTCKSILNSDYNMIHFGNLSAKTKFKSGSKVQIDLNVVHEGNAKYLIIGGEHDSDISLDERAGHDKRTEKMSGYSDGDCGACNSKCDTNVDVDANEESLLTVNEGVLLPLHVEELGGHDNVAAVEAKMSRDGAIGEETHVTGESSTHFDPSLTSHLFSCTDDVSESNAGVDVHVIEGMDMTGTSNAGEILAEEDSTNIDTDVANAIGRSDAEMMGTSNKDDMMVEEMSGCSNGDCGACNSKCDTNVDVGANANEESLLTVNEGVLLPLHVEELGGRDDAPGTTRR